MNMKKSILHILVLLFWASHLTAQQHQGQQQPTFQQVLYEQVLIQEDRAAFYLTQMQINPNTSGKFREAEKMLEIKEILYKNFASSPALTNPYVSGYLLKIMSQEKIEAAELKALQKLVNEELHRQ
jgi:hypothetical protein